MVQVRSTWANKPIIIGGVLGEAEWSDAGQIGIPAGYLMVKNDADYVYIALDLVGDRGHDPGTDDYFWFTIDVDGNRQITPNRDVNYGLYPGRANQLGRQFYLGSGRWTGLLNEESDSRVRTRFLRSPNSETPHRIWEMRLTLEELGVDLDITDAPLILNFGVRVSSTNPRFTYDYPYSFYRNFRYLHQIVLARNPDTNYPDGTAGAVIGGVGVIPASAIKSDGRATTDQSYFKKFSEAAFGSTMHLIGNRVTMQNVWNRGARKYRMLHRFGNSGSFAPIRQNWSNYRWDGTTYVLEPYGPDDDNYYVLLNPSQDYSIDDLLLQWRSVGFPAGLHQFQTQFFDNADSIVTTPTQILSLMVDNNLPRVEIEEIRHNGNPVSTCGIVQMANTTDGLQFLITVDEAEGHLLKYDLRAFYGENNKRLIVSDRYENHQASGPEWRGVNSLVVPPELWKPPTTCAYQFRLSASPRVTNGYHYLGNRAVATQHITILTSGNGAAIAPRILDNLPLGLTALDQPRIEGEEPERLGAATIE